MNDSNLIVFKDRETDTVWLRYNGEVPPFTNWARAQPEGRWDWECAYGTWNVGSGEWGAAACDIGIDIVCERPFGTTTSTTTTTTTTTTLPGKSVFVILYHYCVF